MGAHVLPLPTVLKSAKVIGRQFGGSKMNRKRVQAAADRLGIAMPEFDRDQREDLVLQSYEHLAMLAVELAGDAQIPHRRRLDRLCRAGPARQSHPPDDRMRAQRSYSPATVATGKRSATPWPCSGFGCMCSIAPSTFDRQMLGSARPALGVGSNLSISLARCTSSQIYSRPVNPSAWSPIKTQAIEDYKSHSLVGSHRATNPLV